VNTNPPTKRRVALVAAGTVAALFVAVLCGLVIGPTSTPAWRVVGNIFAHLGTDHLVILDRRDRGPARPLGDR
jgi:hypothetical protein